MLVNKTKKLSLYIHIPFCEKKCGYCDFNSYDDRAGRMNDYVKALLSQMAEYAGSAKNLCG
jgi:oxygen-independent coproporphyrinogen-3 oxidase